MDGSSNLTRLLGNTILGQGRKTIYIYISDIYGIQSACYCDSAAAGGLSQENMENTLKDPETTEGVC